MLATMTMNQVTCRLIGGAGDGHSQIARELKQQVRIGGCGGASDGVRRCCPFRRSEPACGHHDHRDGRWVLLIYTGEVP